MTTTNWIDSSDNWTTNSDWSNGAPGSTTDVVVAQGNPQITAPISIASLNDSATVTFIAAGSSAVTGAVSVSGTLEMDVFNGQGGSSLAIGGALSVGGNFNIGNGNLSSATTVSALSLTNFIVSNYGAINISGDTGTNSTPPLSATLNIASAAGFGTAGSLLGSVNLYGNANGHAVLEFASGEIATIATGSELTLSGPDAFLADASNTSSNSALAGLTTVAGALNLKNGASVTTTGALTVTGGVHVDTDNGAGGSTLSIGGAITSSGAIDIGNGNLSAATNVSAAGLTNYISSNLGTVNISGDTNNSKSPITATLTLASAAGFGSAGYLVGSVNLTGNANGSGILEFASGEIATIAASSELTLSGPDAFLADAYNTSSNSALTGLTTVTGAFNLQNGASVTTTGALTVTGGVNVDTYNGEGGSTLSIGGAITSSGAIDIGNGNLSATTNVSATALTNYISSSLGTVNIEGDTGTANSSPNSATLNLASAAGFGSAGYLVGSVNLSGNANGHAVLEFASGEITTIAASSELTLNGPDAFLADASNTAANSALTGLTTVTGAFYLQNGASVTTTGALTVTGSVYVDTYNGEGGSTLSIGGAIASSGAIDIGNANLSAATNVSATALTNSIGSTDGTISISGDTNTTAPIPISATLELASAAGFGTTSTLTGSVNLSGNANGHAVLEFASGEIATIVANSELTLSGPDAFLADAYNTSSNSALTGLTTVAGAFNLQNGASVTATGALTVTGSVYVDTYNGEGGSTLSIGGAIASSGTIGLGNGNLSAATNVSATALTNSIGSTDGTINISGDTNTTAPIPISATLDIASAAGFGTTSTLTGSVNLSGNANGHAVLEFASGEIATIATGSELTLNGPDAFVADASNTSSNSALTGLTTVAGAFNLQNSASVTTTGALTVTGGVNVDAYNGEGGSNLSIGGKLINNATIDLGNGNLSANSNVSAINLLNTSTINLIGSSTNTDELSLTKVVNNTGTININGGGVLSVGQTLVGAGTVNIDGGVLSLGGLASGGQITFGSSGQLDVVNGANVGTITNFTANDKVTLNSYASSYEALFYVSSTGGTLQIVDAGAGDAVVATLTFSGDFSGQTFALTQDATTGGTDIGLANAPWINPQPGDVIVVPPVGAGYSAYQYTYSPGGNFIGSAFYYTHIQNQPFTTEEVDYNGAGLVTRAAFSGLSGTPYSLYEYDYVAGVFEGSKFTYTAVPNGAAYSSYEVDYNYNGVVSGQKFYTTNITNQNYTGEEVDYNASGNATRVLLTGVSNQAYQSLEYDYSSGTYEGYKAYYTGLTGNGYTGLEVDASASGQTQKVIYSGLTSTPYQRIEEDFNTSGAIQDVTYFYDKVSGGSYSAYQVMENSSGVSQQETFDLNSGGHTVIALAGGQTLTSLGDDKMTGSGATTFVLNPIYGHDIVTNFASGDTISLSTSEFANFTALTGAAQNSGANVLITASNGDTLTLDHMNTATLAGMSANFTFHA